MSSRWFWVGLPVLAIGCMAPAAPAGTESDDRPTPQNDEAVSPYATHKTGPPSLCVVGQKVVAFNGETVTLPVPCIPEELLDPGTPVEDDAFDVDAPIERPDIGDIDPIAAERQER